jgi:hypothetical protein
LFFFSHPSVKFDIFAPSPEEELDIHHSSFIIHHSSFIIHHSSFIIHHSPFIINKMKFQQLLFVLFALFFTSCNAQTTAITLSNTIKGNTGHRGIIPQIDGVEAKPIEGKDYFSCTLTMNQDCTLDIVSLTVKVDGGQVNLSPKLDDGKTKRKVKKGDTIYLNVEKDKGLTVAKPSIEGDGSLVVKINGKTKKIPIKEFKMVFPM